MTKPGDILSFVGVVRGFPKQAFFFAEAFSFRGIKTNIENIDKNKDRCYVQCRDIDIQIYRYIGSFSINDEISILKYTVLCFDFNDWSHVRAASPMAAL